MPELAFPPVADLLPHGRRSLLIDSILTHDARCTLCRVQVSASALYQGADGSVPVWVALEYMAQAVAAHGGMLDRAAGRPPRPGLLLGSRRLAFMVSRFEPGSVLEVSVRHQSGVAGLLAFDCAVRLAGRNDVLASGVLNVYLVDNFEALSSDFGKGPGPTAAKDFDKDV